jgi:hypothetical protein
MSARSRREFLFGAAALVGGGVLLDRVRPWAALMSVDRRGRSALRLSGLVSERGSAQTVGAAFLRDAGPPGTLGGLVESIAAEVPVATQADDDLRRALAERVAEDFADGRWVELDGWLVSLTEARLCGIVALVDG